MFGDVAASLRSMAITSGLLVNLTCPAVAMQFFAHPNSDRMPAVTAVLATGEIENGDVQRLETFLAGAQIRKTVAVYLDSPGGSLYEGMRLGMFFRHQHIKTVVEGQEICASACALAFLGGTDNAGKPWRSSSSNSRLGFHAFSSLGTSSQNEAETQLVVSHVLEYGRDVDAPLELLILNFATPADSIYWLNEDEICSLGIKLWDVPGNRFTC